ncbi:hypothetical protein COLO4_29283 [Corchorus olitorius]|uniref:Uncharacterized protein n=1 Tax=Corchorus olitorius TaxID=93759 RepID=A0A1R3HFI4_9ROSI|nr:hypothetical protein COLO4_29283 [Corchorus olitorius]
MLADTPYWNTPEDTPSPRLPVKDEDRPGRKQWNFWKSLEHNFGYDLTPGADNSHLDFPWDED